MNDLDDLKRNTDLIVLLESYGVALKKRGAEWDGLCIAHTETNPSMQVYASKGDGIMRWHCKSCGAGGTVIDAITGTFNWLWLLLIDHVTSLKLKTFLPRYSARRGQRIQITTNHY